MHASRTDADHQPPRPVAAETSNALLQLHDSLSFQLLYHVNRSGHPQPYTLTRHDVPPIVSHRHHSAARDFDCAEDRQPELDHDRRHRD